MKICFFLSLRWNHDGIRKRLLFKLYNIQIPNNRSREFMWTILATKNKKRR
jgi:hypothetical protein